MTKYLAHYHVPGMFSGHIWGLAADDAEATKKVESYIVKEIMDDGKPPPFTVDYDLYRNDDAAAAVHSFSKFAGIKWSHVARGYLRPDAWNDGRL